MTVLALTTAKLSPNPDFVAGNKKFRFRTITTDTGDYITDGIALAASLFGLTRFSALIPQGLLYDNEGGDQYDLGRPVGVRFNTERTIAYLLLYESAGDGDGLDQKPNEALTISTIDLLAIGH